MASDAQMAKKVMRKKMGALIAQSLQQSQATRETEGAAVRQRLLQNGWFRQAKRVSIYVSNEQEIGTDEIVRKALGDGKEVFIPRFKKGCLRMEMLRLDSEAEFDALESTLWGIRQHPANLNPPSFDQTNEKWPLDLIVVPGVAFTVDGKRLGHGRGFYDRFLNEYQEKYGTLPKTIALALQVQLVDDLPMESHDRMIDLVLHSSKSETDKS